MKTIDDYAKHLEKLLCAEIVQTYELITHVTCDSRQVKPGTLFCAIDGTVSNGHDYIKSAIENGAAAIVHSQDLDEYKIGISYLKVKDAYLAYAMACEFFFGCPANKFRLHGITGTNGKTTTAFLLEHILTASNICTIRATEVIKKSFAQWMI